MYSGMYQNPYMMQQQSIYAQRQQIVRVNGIEGARAYQMLPPNSSALLLDENNPLLYLAQTDGAGYKTITMYKIEPYAHPEQNNSATLEDRIKRLEEMVYNGKSDSTDAKFEQKTEQP